jgi:AraC-like DNA-binding protein
MEKDTVSMDYVRAAVARLDAAARRRVLEAAGIQPDLLSAAQARVSAESFAALWLAVADEIDDEFFGLDSRRMKVGSFALLCHAVIGQQTVERALKLMLRGMAVFLDDIRGELRVEGEETAIQLINRIAEPAARRFADETFLVMIHGLMCWLAGRRIPLVQASFAYPRPAYVHEYSVMFSQTLRFDEQATEVRFERRWLSAPVVQDAAALKDFLRTAPQSVFLKYKNEDSWTARLRRRLKDSIGDPDWPMLEQLAEEFELTPATLRRRLLAEGTTYQDIKDELRRDAAIHYLCHSRLSVAEVGYRLGFQEPSAFYRAFKKWTAVQPGEYRLRQGVMQR